MLHRKVKKAKTWYRGRKPSQPTSAVLGQRITDARDLGQKRQDAKALSSSLK